jgi:K+-transporting ATPase ATPase C chain
MSSIVASLRLIGATLVVCCVVYPAVFLGVAQFAFPSSANGTLVRSPDGTVVGSRLIAQAFTSPRYFWPRPSAVGYNGAGAGGSNKSPTNPVLAERARELIAGYGAAADDPLPADLVTASGSGLDPHITEAAARFQVARIAAARNQPESDVEAMIERLAFRPGGTLAPDRIVNVLELNLALDQSSSPP